MKFRSCIVDKVIPKFGSILHYIQPARMKSKIFQCRWELHDVWNKDASPKSRTQYQLVRSNCRRFLLLHNHRQAAKIVRELLIEGRTLLRTVTYRCAFLFNFIGDISVVIDVAKDSISIRV